MSTYAISVILPLKYCYPAEYVNHSVIEVIIDAIIDALMMFATCLIDSHCQVAHDGMCYKI